MGTEKDALKGTVVQNRKLLLKKAEEYDNLLLQIQEIEQKLLLSRKTADKGMLFIGIIKANIC